MRGFIFLIFFGLIGTQALAAQVAELNNIGKVIIQDDPQGLHLSSELRGNPHEKYVLRIHSSCQRITPYWFHFRRSLEIEGKASGEGELRIQGHLMGINQNALIDRDLKAISLFRVERFQRKEIGCTVFKNIEEDLNFGNGVF